jgi:hypothetical protein
MVTSVLNATVTVTGILTQAEPVQGLWDMEVGQNVKVRFRGEGYLQKFLLVFSAISIAQDIAIAAMPTAILWNLQKSRRERVRLMVLLGLGAGAAIAIFVRIFFLMSTQYAKHGMAPIFICTILELGIAIIAGSLAPLRKSFEKWWNGCRGGDSQRMRLQSRSQSLEGLELSTRNLSTLQHANLE